MRTPFILTLNPSGRIPPYDMAVGGRPIWLISSFTFFILNRQHKALWSVMTLKVLVHRNGYQTFRRPIPLLGSLVRRLNSFSLLSTVIYWRQHQHDISHPLQTDVRLPSDLPRWRPFPAPVLSYQCARMVACIILLFLSFRKRSRVFSSPATAGF